MKKRKKRIIIGGILLLIGILVGIVIYNSLKDKNKLSVADKAWLNQNSGTVQNVLVVNDVNVFGKEGSGVFFDFIDDFMKQHNLTINSISYDVNTPQSGLTFKVDNKLDKDDLIIYKDHYVLVGKKNDSLKELNDFSGKKIGIKGTDLSYISPYLSEISNITFVQYDSSEILIKALAEEIEINYILVPANEYMHYILTSNYSIVFHLGDIPIYYSLHLSDQEKDLSNIMKKFYNNWIQSKFDKSYNRHNLNLFIESLDIAEKDKDTLTSRVYNYGFITNSPYEVIMGGNYGGIISTYLKKFSDFSNVEFKFIKYKRSNNLYNAINKKNIDLYFNYKDTVDEFKIVPSLMNIEFNIIAKMDNYIIVNSLKSVNDKGFFTNP